MSMTDVLADMLTRIRNAHKAKLLSVNIPFSKEKVAILDVLVAEGFVDSYFVKSIRTNIQNIELNLKYSSKGVAAIKEISRISKPGKREYKSFKDIKSNYADMGVYVMSTDKGILSDREAKKLGIGGEVICRVF